MTGMDRNTGKHISGEAHLRQSISDILTTPTLTRIMRRSYGSRLFDLVDNPINQSLLVDLYAAVAESLDTWESRFTLERSELEKIEEGHITLTLEGKLKGSEEQIRLEGIII